MALPNRPEPQPTVSDASPAGGVPRPRATDTAGSDADEVIVERANSGDRDAFRTLVERHQHRVFRLMVRRLRCDRDTAADLTQEVFLRVHRGLARFDGRAKFTTWLYKIAINVGISEIRHNRASKRSRWTFSLDAPLPGTDDMQPDPPSTEPAPADQVHHKEIAAAVRAAVHQLPDEFREAVVLRDLQGLSYEEIGEILGTPPGTVRSRIHRGRLLLQNMLAEFRP